MPAHWSDDYLGLQYSEAFDCAAFAEKVRREVFGHDLTLPSDRRDGPFGRNAQLTNAVPDFAVPTDTPAEGDGVLLVARGRVQHIGIYCVLAGEPWVIHNAEGVGVTRRRLREIGKWGFRVEGVYRWI
jgi:hypothetical protein